MLAFDLFILLAGLGIIILSCELFTNGVEWAGCKLDLGEGAVGSVMAAVGTAMPETVVPLVAILLGGDEGEQVGIGAILGAPLMLSTTAIFATGLAILIFARKGGRRLELDADSEIISRDLRFFLAVFAVAVAAAFLPTGAPKYALAPVLLALYLLYAVRKFRAHAGGSEGVDDMRPLHFCRNTPSPPSLLVAAQVLLALGGIVGGARLFVSSVEAVSDAAGVPALVLALLIAPLATEMPESVNSVLWVRRGKDTLALGNISGAMVFQSCIPTTVGLTLTPWVLRGENLPGLVSAIFAMAATLFVCAAARRERVLRAPVLTCAGAFYLAFLVYVVLAAG